jgi:hypothetical protein
LATQPSGQTVQPAQRLATRHSATDA